MGSPWLCAPSSLTLPPGSPIPVVHDPSGPLIPGQARAWVQWAGPRTVNMVARGTASRTAAVSHFCLGHGGIYSFFFMQFGVNSTRLGSSMVGSTIQASSFSLEIIIASVSLATASSCSIWQAQVPIWCQLQSGTVCGGSTTSIGALEKCQAAKAREDHWVTGSLGD